MVSRTLQREVCRKSGVILTCYVNGRKRFRAVPVNPRGDRARGRHSPPIHR
jgi:hypothetical protein